MSTTTKLLQTPMLDPATTTVLVTGASGFIASHIVNEALKIGYSVRGTARSEEKAEGTRKLFNNPKYSTAIIEDFTTPSQQIDDAIKGVDAIVHVASDTSFGDDPKVVVDGVVRGTLAFLEAANKEPKVKRVVLTSSSAAATLAIPNKEMTITTDTWNDVAVDTAWNKPGTSIGPNPYPFVVYAASKTEGEKALWKYAKEQKPHYVVNAVLPNMNVGAILGVGGPTGSVVPNLYKGEKGFFPPQYFINVTDNARLHLIPALLDESVQNERIFAFADTFNWTRIVDAIVKARPAAKERLAKFRDENEEKDLSTVPNQLGAELLKKWFGQDGYTSLQESVEQNLQGIE